MARAFLFLLFAVLTQLIIFSSTSAQTVHVSPGSMLGRRAASKTGNVYSSAVTTELRRQQKFLQDVAARFEAVSVHELTPLLSYSYVWKALRENRGRLASSDGRMTAEQSKALERGYDLLETDVLLLFVDHQLSVLNETLELDEAQYSELEKILSTDLGQKRALVTDNTISSETFSRRLQALSDQTEKKLLSILLPDQRKAFHRQLMLNRDRLVG